MVTTQTKSDEKQFNIRTLTWGDLTWVDICQPGREALDYLEKQYNFHPLDLEDSISPRQLSKVEEYPEYLFIIFHLSVYQKTSGVSVREQWSAFVGDKFLVTLRPQGFKAPEELFHDCELSEDARQEHFANGSGFLLYRILDRALDAYFPVMDKILSLMEGIEDNVFREEVEAARELSILRRDIITQRRVMFPTRALLGELEKKLKRFSKTDLTLYYSDLMDHMNKICETLDEHTEVIEVFKDADYLLSNYRANRTIRSLAVLFAVGLPVLVVSGLYVMLPGVAKGSVQVFLLLLLIILLSVGGMLYFFRRRRLI